MNLDTIESEEIVDGFMIPAKLTPEQKRHTESEFAVFRQKRIAEQSEPETLYGQLLQLKIRMEDYLSQDMFDPKRNFAHFLKSYIEIQHKKKKDVASELDIHNTKLSQLLSGLRQPSEDIFVRLEFHSGQFIPARNWYRLAVKQQEHMIMTNSSLRNRERKHVKGHLQFDF